MCVEHQNEPRPRLYFCVGGCRQVRGTRCAIDRPAMVGAAFGRSEQSTPLLGVSQARRPRFRESLLAIELLQQRLQPALAR